MLTRAPGIAIAVVLAGCGGRSPDAKPPDKVPPPQKESAPVPPTEVTVFHLYKFGQRIGIEHARVARAADGSGTVRTSFTFNDRGTDVPLAAQWKLSAGGVPTSYQAWGFVARGVPVDDRVEVDGDSIVNERLSHGAKRGKRP
ncbi:MAG TPA: hypothetical protein VIU61_06085, partial [Kofleriaceae bacterium]